MGQRKIIMFSIKAELNYQKNDRKDSEKNFLSSIFIEISNLC
jgi:hypothetical protein